jgi:hypothetical protein
VGASLSEALSMPLIDKDAILEALFDALGCSDRDERFRLSRASDEVLYSLAQASHGAILVNWWDHDSAPARLRDIASVIVEVFCDCPVEVAAARFEARRRHAGHQDVRRSSEEIDAGARRMRETFRGPLGVGPIVRVDTEGPVSAHALARQVRSALDTSAL